VGYRDLASLRLLFKNNFDEEGMNILLSKLTSLSPSHQKGLQALDLAAELLLLPVNVDKVVDGSANIESWLLHLQQLRRPESHRRDQREQNLLKELPLPRNIKVRWERRNDTTGVEVRFFVSSAREFKDRLDQLSKIKEQIGDELWTTDC
jgi:hypothetical protein